MQVIENESIVFFDVDQTLVMHENVRPLGGLDIINPYSGSKISVSINNKHVELLKQFKGRGMFIIVWSAAGVLWAQAVVNALGLQDEVDMVMTKSSKFVDDLEADQVLGQRIYLK